MITRENITDLNIKSIIGSFHDIRTEKIPFSNKPFRCITKNKTRGLKFQKRSGLTSPISVLPVFSMILKRAVHQLMVADKYIRPKSIIWFSPPLLNFYLPGACN